MARAGLDRLGLDGHITDRLGLDVMLPAPGQGALAVQCRSGDQAVLEVLETIDEPRVRAAVAAERAFLEGLGGGCSAPVGAFATAQKSSAGWELNLKTVVGMADGSRMIRLERSGYDPVELGRASAEEALTNGAGPIMSASSDSQGSPLGGKRVVVTRAREQARRFCRRLEAAGAVPVVVPVIRIVPPADTGEIERAFAGLDRCEWAIFTSVNGVKQCWSAMAGRGLDTALFANVRVAAVGAATADELRVRGVEPDFVPERYVGEEIARGLKDLEGKRVCLLRAKVAGSGLPDLLHEKGADVLDVAVYENVPEEIGPQEAAQLKSGVDIVTFTSGSTVENFVSAVRGRPDLERILEGVPCACIGPVTETVARDRNMNVAVVADVHTTDGLYDALVAYFDREKGSWLTVQE
jgi:uroporphyrinogen-III synthase